MWRWERNKASAGAESSRTNFRAFVSFASSLWEAKKGIEFEEEERERGKKNKCLV